MVGRVRFAPLLALFVVACGSSPPADPPPPRVAAPDGGLAGGHGDEPRQVRVPENDSTAPEASLSLGGSSGALVRLDSPVLAARAVGRDKQGMARIRVSLEARLRCGDEVVPLIRYFPPPEIGRPTLPPGRLVPTARSRRVSYELRCTSGELRGAEGTLWADATSAWEREASSTPIRFTYRP
jgi:hypothetical protein